MNTVDKQNLTLPALRGVMGQWVYYSCLISLEEISKRVSFADVIHKSKQLSGMIQRTLQSTRSVQIANYIKNQPERFFNSLVVATYGGQPNWHAIKSIKSTNASSELNGVSEDVLESVGFLTFRGDEKLFAIDGQHRLAGIKKAVVDGLPENHIDEVSVIFVAHKVTKQGLERTRRLFTTLNKTARPVSKGDIIALDEDDVMAICVRRLIEETDFFSEKEIAFVATNNMPSKNMESITTIGNLYDLLTILFTESEGTLKAKKVDLQRSRPNEDVLNSYFELAKKYITLLDENFSEVRSFLKASDPSLIVSKHRGSHGGKITFRPIGLDILTRVIAKLTKSVPLEDAVKIASKLPRDLADAPFSGLMWNPSTQTISNANNVTLREILMYMVGASKLSDSTLLARYRKAVGDEGIKLPKKVAH
jgi:DNA sulfur modification protein DndB